MLAQDFLVKHGIVTIGVIYFAFNLVHKKLVNLVIFLTVLVLSYPFFVNKMNGLVFTLVSSLCIGIVRNFHLLENFEDHKKIVRLSNRLLNKMPSYKIKKVSPDLKTLKLGIPVETKDIQSIKQELENGYSALREYPIFISNDNIILQGNVLYKAITEYPELNGSSLRIYKINETKQSIVDKLPLIKIMSGISEHEFSMLDISKL